MPQSYPRVNWVYFTRWEHQWLKENEYPRQPARRLVGFIV